MEMNLQTLDAAHQKEVWRQRVTSCRSSGKTVRVWCQEQQLSQKTYYYWQRRIFKTLTEQPVFAEITPAPKTVVAATLHMGEAALDIYSGADAATIETVLRALRYAE